MPIDERMFRLIKILILHNTLLIRLGHFLVSIWGRCWAKSLSKNQKRDSKSEQKYSADPKCPVNAYNRATYTYGEAAERF